MTSEAHLVFPTIPTFMQIQEMQEKIQKFFFDFDINAFELVALDTRSY